MKIKKKTSPEPPAPQTLAADIVVIDFPQEEELIVPGHYAVRLTASPDAQVEISINGGDWQPCRGAVGYYWFDWWPAEAGEMTITSRLRVGKGRWKKSSERACTVVGSGAN